MNNLCNVYFYWGSWIFECNVEKICRCKIVGLNFDNFCDGLVLYGVWIVYCNSFVFNFIVLVN